jgi:hypothetical protein
MNGASKSQKKMTVTKTRSWAGIKRAKAASEERHAGYKEAKEARPRRAQDSATMIAPARPRRVNAGARNWTAPLRMALLCAAAMLPTWGCGDGDSSPDLTPPVEPVMWSDCGVGFQCGEVNDLVAAYFVDLQVPADGTTCTAGGTRK